MRIEELKEAYNPKTTWKQIDALSSQLHLGAGHNSVVAETTFNELKLYIHDDMPREITLHPYFKNPIDLNPQIKYLSIVPEYGGYLSFAGFREAAKMLQRIEIILIASPRQYGGPNVDYIVSPLSVMFMPNLEHFDVSSNNTQLNAACKIIRHVKREGGNILDAQQKLVDAGLEEYAEIK